MSTLLNLEEMLTETTDQIPEAPDYSNPPPGDYTLEVKDCAIDKYKTKAKDNEPSVDAQRLKLTYAVAKTIEVANNEQPVPDGTLFTETFQATEQGLGYFKKRIKEVMGVETVAGVTLGDMMDSVKGTMFDARLSVKKTAKPGAPGEFYENLQIRVIPHTAG